MQLARTTASPDLPDMNLNFIDLATSEIFVYIFWFFCYFFLLNFTYWLALIFYNKFCASNKIEESENINIFFRDQSYGIARKKNKK
jgi:hypothetical protein